MDRILYLDLVKLFTIYLVILGHVIAMMVNGNTIGEQLNTIIYSFHMPLFMLLSGYFVSSSTMKKPFGEFLITKTKQLLLPAATCAAIACIYLFFCRDTAYYWIEIIGNSWFLKTLFVNYMLFYIMMKTRINDWILLVVSCTLLFVIPGCKSLQLNLLFPYFWGGYMLKKYHVLEHISGSWRYAMFFLIIFASAYYWQQTLGIPNYIEINLANILNKGYLILFRYLVGFSGSLCVISIISLLYHYMKQYTVISRISYYGRYTLGVYVLQTILVVNVFPDTLAWHVENGILLDTIIAPTLSLAFLLVCLYLIHLISKNKILDFFFFGGQYYKKK